MFYLRFLKIFIEKWANRLFPLFWWAKWVNRSGRSPKMSDVSESLRSLTKNEQPWAICSGSSEEMSDCERVAQVAHQKWAIKWIAQFWAKNKIHSENRWANSKPWSLIQCFGSGFFLDLYWNFFPESRSGLAKNPDPIQKIRICKKTSKNCVSRNLCSSYLTLKHCPFWSGSSKGSNLIKNII